MSTKMKDKKTVTIKCRKCGAETIVLAFSISEICCSGCFASIEVGGGYE